MKIDIDNTFVRYGRMHLTKQKGFGKDTFHSPPTSIGFYAMPIRFKEMFLVSSVEEFQPNILGIPKKLNPKFNRDEDGHTKDDFDWGKHGEVHRKKFKRIVHKFTVKNEDYIWHHLDIKQNFIVNEYNGWVKTSVRDWKKALIKESLRLRVESMSTTIFTAETGKSSGGKGFSEVRPKTGCYSKDHFEVFFDSKVY